MTKKQAAIEETILREKLTVYEWDRSEDIHCRAWFGKNYLGDGMVNCEFCKDMPVPFQGYLRGHVCTECQASLESLEGA